MKVRCVGDEHGECDSIIEFELDDDFPGNLLYDSTKQRIFITLDRKVNEIDLESFKFYIKTKSGSEANTLLSESSLENLKNLDLDFFEKTERISLECDLGHENIYEVTVKDA